MRTKKPKEIEEQLKEYRQIQAKYQLNASKFQSKKLQAIAMDNSFKISSLKPNNKSQN